MESADRTSVDVNESPGLDAKKDSSNNANKGLLNKRASTNASDELTTAVGGTIDEDLEHKPLGESKESEEDLKEILTRKVAELETKLKQTEEFYEKLSKDVATTKEQYEREREECEDVVSVAKRNIENQVSKILDLQTKKRELAEKVRLEEDRLMKEEEETRVKLQLEEERLTRNVVVFQTKLLINEGMKFERDQLLSRINFLQNDLAEKEKFYQEELQRAKEQIQEKYERLLQIANIHKGPIADQVKSLSQRQQIVALKQAQEQIVRTIKTYKDATKKLMREMDRNKVLHEINHNMEIQVTLGQSLAANAESVIEEYKKEKKEDLKKISEKADDAKRIVPHTPTDSEIHLRKKIEALKNELYKSRDEEAELSEILEDQRRYLNRVKKQRQQIHDIEQRLIPLADVAEYIVQKGRVEFKQNYEDPAARHEVFQKLSAILTEYDLLQKYMTAAELEEELNGRGKDELSALSPLHEERNFHTRRKLSITPYMEYEHVDKEKKKILSDLGLLGKYGVKQKKHVRQRFIQKMISKSEFLAKFYELTATEMSSQGNN